MNINKKDKRTNLERQIDKLLEELEQSGVVEVKTDDEGKTKANLSAEYDIKLKVVERLVKLRAEKQNKHLTPDTIAVIAGNLLGILLILNYEKLGVVTSKALGFVIRGRV